MWEWLRCTQGLRPDPKSSRNSPAPPGGACLLEGMGSPQAHAQAAQPIWAAGVAPCSMGHGLPGISQLARQLAAPATLAPAPASTGQQATFAQLTGPSVPAVLGQYKNWPAASCWASTQFIRRSSGSRKPVTQGEADAHPQPYSVLAADGAGSQSNWFLCSTPPPPTAWDQGQSPEPPV
ncbi:apolipoprotein C-III isoform X2 [Lepus europaeus]|uniref:apolipoprotein C-III isoform X2 n=1 Tax=Lepus europaeus TaxID=9983 RepID=UPI002B48C559|nr:apolipoprotein C-III isoform X2 [Lepus europaeus]